MHLVLLTLGVTFIIPFFWMLSTSLKLKGQEFIYPPMWIPNPFVWENYPIALTRLPFHLFYRNTIFVTAAATSGTLLAATMAGYSFARLRFPFRDTIFVLVLATMMLPNVVTLIPQFIVFRTLGWVDTFLPLILPFWLGGGAFNIFLARQFFMTLPYELDEAARVDGAGSWRIWWQLMLPLSKPVVATIALFSFIHRWNDFMEPLIYLNSLELKTVAVGLRAFQSFEADHGVEMNLMMAAATTMVVPIVILFFFAQRFFMRGIVMTGMGGR